jgi:hypothetical protein
MSEKHLCSGTDHISKIAVRHGYRDWRTLWQRNPQLGQSNPNVLFKGPVLDGGVEINVGSRQERLESIPTETHSKFQCKRLESLFLRLRIFGEDFAVLREADCTLRAEGHRAPVPGRTDNDGIVSFPIPRDAERATLTVQVPAPPSDEEEGSPPPLAGHTSMSWDLRIGALNPMLEETSDPNYISAVQQRLNNLGYPCGEITGTLNRATREALLVFQRRFRLPESGEPDRATQGKLQELHDRAAPVQS